MNDTPLISIVMPVRNEMSYLDASFDRIDEQDYPRERIEIILVDGASTDDTMAIARARAVSDPRITVVPGTYNCPAAMNAGIARARGEFVAKVDGHGYISVAFLKTASDFLTEHPECGCVGGPITPLGDQPIAMSNLLARFSKFGVGQGVYTIEKRVCSVDSVQCGVYRKSALEAVGNFDENMQFGEDEELNYRLIQAGYKIYQTPAMTFYYHIRPSFAALFRQYFNYGCARVKVLKKHPTFFRLKHIIPATLILALAATILLSTVLPVFFYLFMAVALAYVSFIFAGAISIGLHNRYYRFHYIALSLACLHIGYGGGMLNGLIKESFSA